VFRLARKIPENVAMECAITGDPITAERAAHLGLVNMVVDDDHALEGAMALAERIAANSPLAVQESRRVLQATALSSEQDAFAVSEQALRGVMQSADCKEGVAAFIEKRPPQWTGA
jgi:enoyl-CoA hydratase/carnithine racemase